MVAGADDVCPHGLRRGRHHDGEGRCDAMVARWSTPFCSGDGRQAGLLYFAAGYRDTTIVRELEQKGLFFPVRLPRLLGGSTVTQHGLASLGFP
jgi:hypothetical protein